MKNILVINKMLFAVLLMIVFFCLNAQADEMNFIDYKLISANESPNNVQKFRDVLSRYKDDLLDIEVFALKINKIEGINKLEQMKRVNTFVNNIVEYIEDINNYGVDDYWATPREFLENGGDCEDFALTKYFILKKLGFAIDDLKITLVNDKMLNIIHSLLLVNINGVTYILDNQRAEIITIQEDNRYIPFFAINEKKLYGYAKK